MSWLNKSHGAQALPVHPAEMLAPTSEPQLERGGADGQHEWETPCVLDKSAISKWRIRCLNRVCLIRNGKFGRGTNNTFLGR